MESSNYTTYHWKGEHGEYWSFSLVLGNSIIEAKKNMVRMTPRISSGLGTQKVKSPFDEALFYKNDYRNGENSYIITAREKNITFSIFSNSRQYSNRIIEGLTEVF